MTREQAVQAIEVGIAWPPTWSPAARAACSPATWASRTPRPRRRSSPPSPAATPRRHRAGTGVDDATLARKTDVVRTALALHTPDPADPVGVVAAVGGLEHAALAGFILGGAAARVPVVLDGVIAGAAALVAAALAPDVLDACIAGHRSAEPATPSRWRRWACARSWTSSCGSARAPGRCWPCRTSWPLRRVAGHGDLDSAGVTDKQS
jgi:nicotinate-nucleotide--dimethylbenzimidazole phosphoribosyltransferase